MMLRTTLLLMFIFLLIGCSKPDAPIKIRKPERPRTKQACVAKGGEWSLYPMTNSYFCFIKAIDANRPCLDDGECQGFCVPVLDEAKLRGVCSEHLPTPGGCPVHLVNGKVIYEPCI
jgi:hypothetical protein